MPSAAPCASSLLLLLLSSSLSDVMNLVTLRRSSDCARECKAVVAAAVVLDGSFLVGVEKAIHANDDDEGANNSNNTAEQYEQYTQRGCAIRANSIGRIMIGGYKAATYRLGCAGDRFYCS
jgi:hypothetical protein